MTDTIHIGDRVKLIADDYSEPRGSLATVTEIHENHAGALTVKWEHLESTSSLPVWPSDVEVVSR